MVYKITSDRRLLIVLYILVLTFGLFYIYLKYDDLDEDILETPLYFDEISYHSFSGERDEIRINTTTVFFFFNTECEHCQAEAALVKREISQFNDKAVYFLSTEPIDKITVFAKEYGLENVENVTFGSISPATATAFGISGLPTTLIYSKEGKLLKKFKGEVKIEAVVNPTP